MTPASAREPWTGPILERALQELLKGDGTVTRSPWDIEDALAIAVRHAYDLGRLRGVMELRTCPELAAEIGVDRATVFRWARERRAGWHIGRDILLTPEDVERLRQRV